MDAQKFGSFLQAQRKRQNLTQSQLAEKLHVTDKAVSRWERGVGLPDIQLLEPLSEALDLSLTELIRSELLGSDTLTKDTADAALAETLALAEQRHRKIRYRLWNFLTWAAGFLLLLVVMWFVEVSWIRFFSMFLILQCVSGVRRLIRALLYPETVQPSRGWKFELKILLLTVSMLLYPIIFLSQPYIGLEACGTLAFWLTVLLVAWGLWEVHRYVETMPDGQ